MRRPVSGSDRSDGGEVNFSNVSCAGWNSFCFVPDVLRIARKDCTRKRIHALIEVYNFGEFLN